MIRQVKSPVAASLLLLAVVTFSATSGCDHSRNAGGMGCPTNLAEPGALLTPGSPFPPLTADGWFNGDAPSPEELQGQVFVVDIWASWCGPCKQATPELIATYEHYKERGVRFFGLSQDAPDTLEDARDFVKKAGVPWPNGYGASTADSLGIKFIPTLFVVGRDGRVVWHNHGSPGSLDEAIASALGG